MKTLGTLLCLAVSAALSSAAGLDAKAETTQNELRAMREGVLDALNKGDIDRGLTFLHTNVVVTWHDAQVSRGRAAVKEYSQRLAGLSTGSGQGGSQKQLAKFSAEITVDELAILYGDTTGIAFGSSLEQFQFSNGRNLEVKGRWTATMVREQGSSDELRAGHSTGSGEAASTDPGRGRWVIASLHFSTNLFDNVILSLSQKSLLRLAGVASLVGLVCGWLIGRAVKRRP